MQTTSKQVADLQQDEKTKWTKDLDHIALHVRDVDEAIIFWSSIFNGTSHRFHEDEDRDRAIQLGDTVLSFSSEPGLTGWEREYPHYGFTMTSDNMYSIKARLEAAGVRTHPIWTRNNRVGLTYFRDPSGNLFELYCPQLEGADDRSKTRFAKSKGGDFVPPVWDISYDWDVKMAQRLPESPEGQDRVVGFNHMTLPAHDVEQTARFWTGLFDAVVSQYADDGRPSHVKFSHGFVLHFTEGAGESDWEHALPYYAFAVASDQLLPLKSRLDAAGVVTQPISTRNGIEALTYFRDPNGNLFQLYCETLSDADDAVQATQADENGLLAPALTDLTYSWQG